MELNSILSKSIVSTSEEPAPVCLWLPNVAISASENLYLSERYWERLQITVCGMRYSRGSPSALGSAETGESGSSALG